MELKEYRIKHSLIIEEYQFIEFHLEGLFALLQGKGNDFKELAHRVENDAMGELIRKVKFLIKEYKYNEILTKQDFNILDQIRDDRNYYCHENFLKTIFDNKNNPKSFTIDEDLKKAKNANEKLKQAFNIIKDKLS